MSPTHDDTMHLPRAWLGSALSIAVALLFANASHAVPGSDPLWSRVIAPIDDFGCEWPHGAFLAAPQDGVAIVTSTGLQRIDADGISLWQTPVCPGCDTPASSSGIVDIFIPDNQDVWVAEWQSDFSDPLGDLFAHRIDAVGAVADSATLASSARTADTRILADAAGVTALVAARSAGASVPRMWWVRRSHGAPLEQREIVIRNTPMDMAVNALHPAADGGLFAALQHRLVNGCLPGQPCPDTAELTWLRLAADGAERWRVETDGFVPWPAPQPDGSAWLARRDHGIAHVSADGVLSATLPVAGLAPNEVIFALYGPVAGRLLLVTDLGLHAVDLSGRLRASRAVAFASLWQDPSQENAAATPQGFLVPTLASTTECAVAELLDPDTLAVRRVLRSDQACADGDVRARDLRTHPDGSVYVTGIATNQSCGGELHLMRFGLPGTPAGGLLFRDGFGP